MCRSSQKIKDGERRVALDPPAVQGVVAVGADVLMQAGAGRGAGFEDDADRRAGGRVVPEAADAEVTGIDVDLTRLREAHRLGTVTATPAPSDAAVAEALAGADLVIGAALVPGTRAPVVVTAEHVRAIRPGSVVVDLAIDQGGCVATARPTSLSDPVYASDGVIHSCATNVPRECPRTATRGTQCGARPVLMALARNTDDGFLAGDLYVCDGTVVHPVVAAAIGEEARAG